jgi:cell division septal protein FtsQ
VKPGRRKAAGLRRWITWRAARLVLSALLVGYAGYYAVDLVASASSLQVGRIAVHGNERLSAGEVRALIDGLRGSNILTADLTAYRRKLLESPWIEAVALRRLLPGTVEVFLEERRPIGLSRFGGTLHLVDRTGTLIDEFGPQYAEFDLPIIDGLVRPPDAGGPAVDEERAALAARVIDAVAGRRRVAERLSQIDVSDVHDAVVLLDGDPARLRLGTERFLERLEAYIELAPAFREQFPEIDYVDLRFEERFYVRPADTPGGRSGKPRPTPSPAARRF